jgi:hypothetical protein
MTVTGVGIGVSAEVVVGAGELEVAGTELGLSASAPLHITDPAKHVSPIAAHPPKA